MTLRALFMMAVVLGGPIVRAHAWHSQGHVLTTNACVRHLGGLIPEFMVTGSDVIAHCSVDPDAFKFRTDSSILYRAEYPEHFLDMEVLDGADLPETRALYLHWCHEHHHDYSQVGTLPYAITEWTYRLTVALAEHRRWPENQAIRQKCLVYAGNLAHYAEDACQPLHATIHWDGRALADGSSPRTGIHARVDALIQQLRPDQLARPLASEFDVYDNVLEAVWQQTQQSNALVDALYAIEDLIPEMESRLPQDGPVVRLTRLCQRRCTLFLGSLYRTSWVKSASVEIPDWHQR